MTPNDKLPEEIQTQVCNASAQYLKKLIADKRDPCCYAVTDYIAGATAWAPWKVRYDELLESFMKLFKSNSELTSEYERLHKQAQRMADALEELVELKRMSDEEPLSLDYLKRKVLAWEAARKALRQFKDGKKGVELSCMVCGTKFMGPEPVICCSGRDCGCMGMPIDPIVCSKECYENLPNKKKDGGKEVGEHKVSDELITTVAMVGVCFDKNCPYCFGTGRIKIESPTTGQISYATHYTNGGIANSC